MLAPSSRAMLLRAAMRAGGAVCCAKRVGSVLGSGLAAPALLRAAPVTWPVTVPSLINLHNVGPTTGSRYDLRVALGLAAGCGFLAAQPDATECAPKRKAGLLEHSNTCFAVLTAALRNPYKRICVLTLERRPCVPVNWGQP